ncbi:hypothetical protein KDAU_53430 [Dictyobacter aurantiacus]|uniref:Uncharacterized protein n=1 Tax=Dictyobacter aurantiacus TaxID=1936993 RepID=A0A401ZMG6_9CHLR|nr:hypothetical protein KDAU_53430 [Dictyobacter aurantiacus]
MFFDRGYQVLILPGERERPRTGVRVRGRIIYFVLCMGAHPRPHAQHKIRLLSIADGIRDFRSWCEGMHNTKEIAEHRRRYLRLPFLV